LQVKMATNNDGGFMESTFNAVGDPYFDPPRPKVHESKGKRQFQTCNSKIGQSADNWGEGKREFFRLSENEAYQEPFRREQNQRLDNIKKMNTPSGFKYSSPAQQHSSTGDYHGAFGRNASVQIGLPYEHFSDGTHGKRGNKTKIEESLEKRNIQTNPGKRGTFGYVGTRIGGQAAEYAYTEDPYDADRLDHRHEIEQHHILLGEKKPFKSMCHALDVFDTEEHTAASKVYAWDDKCAMRPETAQDKMTPKERAELNADGVLKEGYKPFIPSSFTKSSVDASTFEPFPEYMSTEFSEKMLRKYMMPDRNGPVKESMLKHNLSEAMAERKPFRPNSFSKSKMTRSVCLMNISSRHV